MPALFDEHFYDEIARLSSVMEELNDQEIETAVKEMICRMKNILLVELKTDASSMLLHRRREDKGFRRRNLARWNKSFDLLEMIWVISLECGQILSKRYSEHEISVKKETFQVLRHLHARSLFVFREIVCLLQGGYADGALSRWRTLHELSVMSQFICNENSDLAKRYISSFHFRALFAAKQMNEHAVRAGMQPFSEEEMQQFRDVCIREAELHGSEMYDEYGWAEKVIGHSKPTFAEIEKRVGLDHWRPRYRWASQHTHGGYRPERAALGLAETLEEILLVGSSNSGMVDPVHMSAITITTTTASFLLIDESLDGIIFSQILKDLAEEVGNAALEEESGSMQPHVTEQAFNHHTSGAATAASWSLS